MQLPNTIKQMTYDISYYLAKGK